MKKLFLSMGLACLFMFACNNAPKQQEATEEAIDSTEVVVEEVVEEHVCPMAQLKCEFENWANLDEETQKGLVGKAIELFSQEQESCCGHEGEEGHECEMTEEMKAMMAKLDEWKAQFANVANMSLEEQKDLIMARFEMMKPCCKHAAEEAAENVVENAVEAVEEVVGQ